MAIIYSYPLNDDIKPLDELVGTTEKTINGQLKTVTRNFLLQDLAEFFIVDGGLQKEITLTTDNSTGAATLNQVTGILNIPRYDLGSVTSVSAIAPITSTGGTTPVISTSMSTNKLIGRYSTGTGIFEEITLGTGLSFAGNVLNSTAAINPAALTKVDDTNVILTLGGSPSNALLQGVSLTLGWAGTLADSRITSSSNWNTAYNNRITNLTTTGSGAATLVSNTLNIPTPVAPALVFLNEGTGNGIARSDRNPTLFGNIGLDAFDISLSDGTDNGALGEQSFAVGYNVKARNYGSTAFGYLINNNGTGSFDTGFNLKDTGYTNFVTGIGHDVTSMNTTVVGQASNIISTQIVDFNATTTKPLFVVGNGTIQNGNVNFNVLTRSDAFIVRMNGLATLPSVTNALITADTTGKAVVTKEYLTNVVGSQNLQQVTNLGATTTNSITANSFIKSGGTSSQILAADGSVITAGTNITISGGTISSTGGGGSIPHATASGTDTYTATVTGVVSYSDGDAYLIRFTNGNTTVATLNINSLGAIPLYRNNDGPLIGGDVQSNGEMLCVYNSTANTFQCIGTSPNSIISYVTNADSVTITKGQVVYAFGGTGDRMTVKLASNIGDSTSAQTVGIVLSTSIAANQKGFIIFQGLLDNLSVLPTSTWADGDPVYLGVTAGSITKIKPYAPNHLVYIGIVTTASNGAAGRMYVRVQNGYELDELHNVQAQTPTLKDTLYYDNTVSPAQWKTSSISSILGFTPANDANVVHLAGTETITGTKTFTSTIYATSENDYAISAISTNSDGISAETTNGSGVVGSSINGIGGVFLTTNNANIAQFQTGFDIKVAIKNDGKITATAGTASTDVVVKSQLDTKQDTITLSAIGTVPNANAATLTGSVLNLQPASLGFGGVVTTGTQSFSGTKTFGSNIVIPATGSPLILSVSSGGTVSGLTTTTYPDLTELTYVKDVTSAIQTQLNGKVTGNTAITGATKTKITYDSKGLVTAGADIATTDISDFNSATRAQVEAELVAGTNITITPSGTGATRQLTIAATGGSSTQGAFTVLANNTNATATPTEHVFKSVAEQTYSGTITWGASAPQTILSNTYEWQQIGKMVNLRVNLSYSTAGTNQTVTITLPTDLPNPSNITGFTSASEVLSFGSGLMFLDRAVLPASAGRYCLLRRNATNNGYEIVVTHGSSISVRNVALTIQYFA